LDYVAIQVLAYEAVSEIQRQILRQDKCWEIIKTPKLFTQVRSVLHCNKDCNILHEGCKNTSKISDCVNDRGYIPKFYFNKTYSELTCFSSNLYMDTHFN
jgi:hypothetical protein